MEKVRHMIHKAQDLIESWHATSTSDTLGRPHFTKLHVHVVYCRREKVAITQIGHNIGANIGIERAMWHEVLYGARFSKLRSVDVGKKM